MSNLVEQYWNKESCGTACTEQSKYSLEYFEEIERFRYQHEPFIHSFAQFTRYHGKRILEVGVGAGTDFLQFVRGGAEAYGVDLTEEAVTNTRMRLAVYGLEAAEVRRCNAEALPYDDDSFDLVYSWGVIHHAENMKKVLGEIYRVTRPGGEIKIMVYNFHALYCWYKYLRYAFLKGKFFKSRRWVIYHFQESYGTKVCTVKEIRDLLSKFEHVNLQFYLWDQLIRSGARFEKLRRILHRITPKSMRWYLAFELEKIIR